MVEQSSSAVELSLDRTMAAGLWRSAGNSGEKERERQDREKVSKRGKREKWRESERGERDGLKKHDLDFVRIKAKTLGNFLFEERHCTQHLSD